MLLDSDGLRLQPMRLHTEQQAWLEEQKAAGRLPEDYREDRELQPPRIRAP